MPRGRRAASAAVVVFLCLQLGFAWSARGIGGLDFCEYFVTSKALRQGSEIYAMKRGGSDALWTKNWDLGTPRPGYLYSPLLAALVTPLTALRLRVALAVWRVLSVAALLAAAIALSLLVAGRWVDPIVFGVAALWVPAYATLYTGQVNNFILLAVALFLFLARRQRTGVAGLVLAVGLALKPLPAPLLAYLAWRRDYRALLAVLLGLAAMLALTVGLAGRHGVVEYLKNAPAISGVSPFGPTNTYPPNQSVFGFLGRALTVHPYGPSIADDPEASRLLSLAAVGAIVLTIAALTLAPWEPDTFTLEIALVLAAIPLVEPFGEYHHATLVIVPFVLSLYATESRAAKGLLAAALALLDAQGLLWHRLVGNTCLLSLGTYGLVMIFSITALALRAQRKTVRFAAQAAGALVPR